MRYFLAAAAILFLTPAANATEHRPSSPATAETIKRLIDSPDRPGAQKERDLDRHPLETLTFCGIEPGMTVVEIWPGGQGAWYRRIIEPLLEDGGGQYVPVEGRSAFPERVDGVPYGEADLVLVFRAHGFMIYDRPAQEHVDAVYSILKPGGIFCIVDHAGDEAVPQDPAGENGYVNESHFFMLAKRAGFNILAASDHNRNPKDTKDHPHGVWSLPPTLRGSLPLTPARRNYQEIGESDRFTHKYYRPE